MARTPTPYHDLNQVLVELVEGVRIILGEHFVGAYLQGSFAVGDFDAHSDVDFIMVSEEELAEREVVALQALHGRIYDLGCPWTQHLEGSYMPKQVLRLAAPDAAPLWFLDHGSRTLVPSNHCDTIVVRWVVREYGVTLAGPPPRTLVEAIPVAALRQDIQTTMREWGQQIVSHPEAYNNRWYQCYIVLNYCRMLHDLHAGHPGSKRAGAEWAKAMLDPSWAGLIDRTWAGRPNPAWSVRQSADPMDFQATLAFVRYMVEESRAYVGDGEQRE